jgi:hypothetical protein
MRGVARRVLSTAGHAGGVGGQMTTKVGPTVRLRRVARSMFICSVRGTMGVWVSSGCRVRHRRRWGHTTLGMMVQRFKSCSDLLVVVAVTVVVSASWRALRGGDATCGRLDAARSSTVVRRWRGPTRGACIRVSSWDIRIVWIGVRRRISVGRRRRRRRMAIRMLMRVIARVMVGNAIPLSLHPLNLVKLVRS